MTIIGKRIKEIRKMTLAEAKAEGWEAEYTMVPVIVLEDGTKLYASSDEEGNQAGALFGKKGKTSFYVMPAEKKLKKVM
jgi:hypothetical protein